MCVQDGVHSCLLVRTSCVHARCVLDAGRHVAHNNHSSVCRHFSECAYFLSTTLLVRATSFAGLLLNVDPLHCIMGECQSEGRQVTTHHSCHQCQCQIMSVADGRASASCMGECNDVLHSTVAHGWHTHSVAALCMPSLLQLNYEFHACPAVTLPPPPPHTHTTHRPPCLRTSGKSERPADLWRCALYL